MINRQKNTSVILAASCVLFLVTLSACEKSEERDFLVGNTYQGQSSMHSKVFRCALTFEADGKARLDDNGDSSEWNYDVSGTEVRLAKTDTKAHPVDSVANVIGTLHLVLRADELYSNPCGGGNLKKI
jgi:hypothetical protein